MNSHQQSWWINLDLDALALRRKAWLAGRSAHGMERPNGLEEGLLTRILRVVGGAHRGLCDGANEILIAVHQNQR